MAVAVNQNYALWMQQPFYDPEGFIRTNRREFVHLDINGWDCTNCVIAAQKIIAGLAYAATYAASSAALFALISSASPVGIATYAFVELSVIIGIEEVVVMIANRYFDPVIGMIARASFSIFAMAAAVSLAPTAVLSAYFPGTVADGLALAFIASCVAKWYYDYSNIVSGGLHFLFNQIPNVETRTLFATGEANNNQRNRLIRNITPRPAQWRGFLNQYVVDHTERRHANRRFFIPFQDMLNGSEALRNRAANA